MDKTIETTEPTPRTRNLPNQYWAWAVAVNSPKTLVTICRDVRELLFAAGLLASPSCPVNHGPSTRVTLPERAREGANTGAIDQDDFRGIRFALHLRATNWCPLAEVCR